MIIMIVLFVNFLHFRSKTKALTLANPPSRKIDCPRKSARTRSPDMGRMGKTPTTSRRADHNHKNSNRADMIPTTELLHHEVLIQVQVMPLLL